MGIGSLLAYREGASYWVTIPLDTLVTVYSLSYSLSRYIFTDI